VAGTLFAGWLPGLAVVLAVKGLGRHAELEARPPPRAVITGRRE
jgi:hypothetical protein